MSSKTKLAVLAAVGAAALLAGCETTNMKMGSAGSGDTVATGGAGGATSSGENSQLEKCPSSLGTVSLVENENAGWYTILRNEYRLPPTANLLAPVIINARRKKGLQFVAANSDYNTRHHIFPPRPEKMAAAAREG